MAWAVGRSRTMGPRGRCAVRMNAEAPLRTTTFIIDRIAIALYFDVNRTMEYPGRNAYIHSELENRVHNRLTAVGNKIRQHQAALKTTSWRTMMLSQTMQPRATARIRHRSRSTVLRALRGPPPRQTLRSQPLFRCAASSAHSMPTVPSLCLPLGEDDILVASPRIT